MKKYLRLLRLQDQYLQIGAVLGAAIYLQMRGWDVVFWIVSTTCSSFVAFIINELVDREDTDKYSWNKLHIKKGEKFNPLILAAMILGFSFLALFLSYLIGLFWWGMIILIVGILYSLKTIRLKGRFGLDLLAQIYVWFVGPFLGLISLYQNIFSVWELLLTILFLALAGIFPYQLADFQADLKAGLKNTHVVLGMKNSLIFGGLAGIVGILFFIIFKIYLIAPWSFVMVGFGIYSVYKYMMWYKMSSKNVNLSLQNYVLTIKPLSQLLIPYLLVWYFVV